MVLAGPGATDGERLVTAGLVGLAALWVFLGYTRAPQPRKAHQVRMIVYFIGLLVIASALASREYIFFLFLITGFFHASVLRPWPVVFAGVFATSVLVNTVIGGFPTNPEWWTIYVAIIAIQTLVIGGGVLLSERMAEQSEQRRLAVTRLEAALDENAGLHAQLLTQAREAGVLDERQRMAREIHDTIAQGLTGIVTQLEAAEQASDRPADRQRHVRNAIGLARESLSEARRSVEALRPEHLETARLPDALAEVARAVVGAQRRARRGGHHGRRPAAPRRGRGGAAADGAGGARPTSPSTPMRSRAWLTLSYMGDVVTLDVRDDGVGFTVPDDRPTGAASGFGLSAMRQRVEPRGRNAGDRIRARRRDGDLGPRPGDRGARHGRPVMTPPIRLLIVDDHPVVRDGLRGMFSGDPEFDVVGEAADGAEAIELASRLDPDVILMDLRMPGVNGARRSAHCRAADPVARARPDDLRLRQRRRAGHRGRGHRLPAEGFASRGAVPRGPRRVARRVRARLVGRDTPDEPAPRRRRRTRSAIASSRSCHSSPRARPTAGRRPSCSSRKRRSRRTCSTSTRS